MVKVNFWEQKRFVSGCRGTLRIRFSGKLLRTYWEILLLLKTSKSTEYPASIYLFKVNNRNSRTMCEIGSKLRIKIKMSLSLLLTLNRFHTLFWFTSTSNLLKLGFHARHFPVSFTKLFEITF